ncbi:Dam family site-specific DNA-(adenine-N6)-methyltransferase [Cupriavidus sp. D384]|uniref:Dam family site-specific DNA-(adenine-N6)-methyltransferase n=1 Tax=Cupriavidus sp. D384 TaxID=1538095 RepID=UPI0009EF2E1D|nr:Dam family site-specific DNA-(adenine-N6)-methyltransferase [Cupriavidus sp. D384]
MKWPGGKTQLLPTLRRLLPAGNRLVEPFLGGASVFLGTDFPSYLLLDAHVDLIGMYKQMVKRPERVIELARPLFSQQAANEEIYLFIREAFNQATPPDVRAAYFLYLNKFGFNGLSRYSAKGNFNVPWNRAVQAPALPEENILAFSERAREKAVIVQGDFTDAFKLAVPGDVIYCDPPYVDLDDAPTFTKYTAEGFPRERQQELADLARITAARGIPVVISNHLTSETRELYRGAECHEVEVRRSVAAQASDRKAVVEGIFLFKA